MPNGAMPLYGRIPELVLPVIVGSGYLLKMLSAPNVTVARLTGPKLSAKSLTHFGLHVWSPAGVVP